MTGFKLLIPNLAVFFNYFRLMELIRDFSLKPYNTFGIDVSAELAFKIETIEELQGVFRQRQPPYFILGGGSNVLLTRSVKELVLLIDIQGVEVVSETAESVEVAVGAGVGWHDFVLWALAQNYGGIENLSLIPGKTGAAPMQNIGAYGVEIRSILTKVEAVKITTGELRTFSNAECQFGYRESIFKHQLKDQFCIAKVYFQLTKPPHQVSLNYQPVIDWMSENGVTDPTIQQVSAAVIAIRQSKLPDPKLIGNSGSFFKNPELSAADFAVLKKKFPQVPSYPLDDGRVKVPAGWLIDQAGWKGYRKDDAGVHAKQALVLVNYGEATGSEILALAQEIQASVAARYGVLLQREVNVY